MVDGAPLRRRNLVRFTAAMVICAAAAVPVSPVEPEHAAAERPPLILSFVGDIMHHELTAEMPDYDRLYDAVRPLLDVDDLSFANIEFPVDPSREPSGYPIFNGTVEYVEAAIRAGFDVFSLANNHTYDLGESGVTATRDVFRSLADRAQIVVSGIRDYPGAPLSVTDIRRRGWRIGFLAITSFSNVWGSDAHINLVNYRDPVAREQLLDAVRWWRREFDLLIVSVHDGVEYVLSPPSRTVEFFRDLSDAGVDIVWGHHPHVLQPWEHRNGRVIIYSAGNFVSAQRRHQNPLIPFGRWGPTGDTAVFQVRAMDRDGHAESRLVRAPVFTTFDHPEHGLVLATVEQTLVEDMSLAWRAFYLARFVFFRGFQRSRAFVELEAADR